MSRGGYIAEGLWYTRGDQRIHVRREEVKRVVDQYLEVSLFVPNFCMLFPIKEMYISRF